MASLPASWQKSLTDLVRVPDEFHAPLLDRAAALRILRCTAQLLDELIASGLPCTGSAASERFDPCDIYNLGLYSGSGTSFPELVQKVGLRFLSAPITELTCRRVWRIQMRLSCPERTCSGCDWRARLVESVASGDIGPGRVLNFQASRPGSDPYQMLIDIESMGSEHAAIAEPVVRQVFDEIVYGGLRFQLLPPQLRAQPLEAVRLGVIDCVAAAALACTRYAQAGIPVRGGRGYFLAPFAAEHAWAEIDMDGQWLPVDPLLAMLARVITGPGSALAAHSLGGYINRVFGRYGPVGEELIEHRCSGQDLFTGQHPASPTLCDVVVRPLR